ncbi:excinuclease ABC subunit A, partial [Achromatium sp. WMS2]
MPKPDVDHIEGLSPAISIEQKTTSHNPRSTVGTITEIHDYLRLLFARVGTPHCPEHNLPLDAQTVGQMVDQVSNLPNGTKLMLLAPMVTNRKGGYRALFQELAAEGFPRVRINNVVYEMDNIPELKAGIKHSIEVVVDRFRVRPGLRLRLIESFETTLRLASGVAKVVAMDESGIELLFSDKFACPYCGYSLIALEPRLFSFNNPAGACPTCDGLGVEQKFDPNKIVVDPELSLSGGAIPGWDVYHCSYYFQQLQALAAHYEFSLDRAWKQLSDKHKELVLYGSDQTI